MTSNSPGGFQNSGSHPDGSAISSVLEKEFRLHLEECSLTDEEVKIIAELDILLRKSYRDLEEGIEEIGEDRLNGILEKLEAAPEIAVLQRTALGRARMLHVVDATHPPEEVRVASWCTCRTF